MAPSVVRCGREVGGVTRVMGRPLAPRMAPYQRVVAAPVSTAPVALETTTAGTNNHIQSSMPTLAGLLHQARANALLDARAKAKMATCSSQKDNKVQKSLKCPRSENFTICNLLFGNEEQENNIDIEKLTPTPLHAASLLPQPAPLVSKLLQSGIPLNETNVLNQTPLHTLLLGDVQSNSSLEALQTLVDSGMNVCSKDNNGDTPLHYVRHILHKGLYNRAADVAKILIQAGAAVDAVNNEGRTILTYSVEHLDTSLSLTQLLVNCGASVWGANQHNQAHSAFVWFLKAVISKRKLENSSQTLFIISFLMSDQPKRMQQHVIRSMIMHSKCYKVLGPIFLELKNLMSPHWSQPQSLSLSCCRSIRKTLTPKRIHHGTTQLPLPTTLHNLLLLKDSNSSCTIPSDRTPNSES
ncbi:unnamed protein product [Meganyctiphanes norvegica]|uniref:SOCS box domain-containing protein n=1 Tax=Meganyctiphanes norvegica TaxID=48144 RepID=A0AAV2RBN7_MEGNR